jgi:hypothetical protein
MMKRVFVICGLMSILALPLTGLSEGLPERFSFERYAPMLNRAPFGAASQRPASRLGIKSIEWDERVGRVRIFLNDGGIIEKVRPVPPILEDGIMYPVLPPKRPKQ